MLSVVRWSLLLALPTSLASATTLHCTGAYATIEGDGTIKFVQYTAGPLSGHFKKTTMRHRTAKLEAEAVKQLLVALAKSHTELTNGFAAKDSNDSGVVSLKTWAAVLKEVLQLDLPWMSFKGRWRRRMMRADVAPPSSTCIAVEAHLTIPTYARVCACVFVFRGRSL